MKVRTIIFWLLRVEMVKSFIKFRINKVLRSTGLDYVVCMNRNSKTNLSDMLLIFNRQAKSV